MNKFLAVDTSSKYLTVLVSNGENLIKRFIPDCALNHSVILMDEVDKAFKEAGICPNECDFFAAVTGPGSFTGIRIGLATIKGFALACEKPIVAVTSFELIAYNVESDKDFLVAIDAAHDHYYVCGYSKDKTELIAPCYMHKDKVTELALPVYGFEALPFENYTALSVENCLHPAICCNEHKKSNDICALYVRKSQAEENRKC